MSNFACFISEYEDLLEQLKITILHENVVETKRKMGADDTG